MQSTLRYINMIYYANVKVLTYDKSYVWLVLRQI